MFNLKHALPVTINWQIFKEKYLILASLVTLSFTKWTKRKGTVCIVIIKKKY